MFSRILFLVVGLWTLVLFLFLLIFRGEGRDASSIGLGRPGRASLGWGLAAAVAAVLACWAGATMLGLAPPSAGELSGVAAIPLWLRLLILITAASTEEILFRSYPITRLQELTGSRLIAAAAPLAVFVLYHLPFHGAGHAMFVSVLGAVTTILFLVRRDLWSNIVCHLLVDIPVFAAPLLLKRLVA